MSAGGEAFAYDHLLSAAGSVPDFYGSTFPRDRMHPLGALRDALRIRDDFAAYLETAARPICSSPAPATPGWNWP